MLPIVFSDFDGTITKLDVTDCILTRFADPSWVKVEEEWQSGAIGSRQCLARQMALVDASAQELNALIDSIPVDPHFPAFCRFVSEREIPFYVVSDGFDYVIRRILRRCGVNGRLVNGSHLFSSSMRIEGRRVITSFPHPPDPCAHGCATCKAAIIEEFGRRAGTGCRQAVFIGDGLSDRFAVEHAEVVFARDRLLEYCRKRGIASRPFESFSEIEAELVKLFALDPADKPPAKRRKRAAKPTSLAAES